MDGLYDEFGNYIGGEISDGEDEDDLSVAGEGMQLVEDTPPSRSAPGVVTRVQDALVLHEDKKYYQDAEELYPQAKAVTFNQDAMDISEPLIKPVKAATAATEQAPSSSSSTSVLARGLTEFHVALMALPAFTRHVAVLGHIHHGKTSFIGELLSNSSSGGENEDDEDEEDAARGGGKGMGDLDDEDGYRQGGRRGRTLHARKDEQERKISIKSNMSSSVLHTRAGKSFSVNLIDNPGHSNFLDESVMSLQASDGAVVVVDAVEGVMLGTTIVLKAAVAAGNTVCLVINKLDRLILELKLPPQDAYFKLLHTLQEFNAALEEAHEAAGTPREQRRRVSPELGNVLFSSSKHGWSFTLDSFAGIYAARQIKEGGRAGFGSKPLDETALAKRLWGDWYHSAGSGAITRNKPADGATRTFTHFVLEPLYKIYAHVLGAPDDASLTSFLRALRVPVKHSEVCSTDKPMGPSRLLRLVLSRFFGSDRHSGAVEMIVRHVPSPVGAAAERKLAGMFSGSQQGEAAQAVRACSPDGPLVAHVVKLIHTPGADANTDSAHRFLALTRIYSGSVRAGTRVRVLGEAFSLEDDEDAADATVAGVYAGLERGARVAELPLEGESAGAGAGSLVLLRGVDASIKKTATIVSPSLRDAETFRAPNLRQAGASVMKVSIEPLRPSQLPSMVEAIRCVSKSYPLLGSKVEGSGEHSLTGPGELYFDCVLRDLRTLYSDVEIKVSDPVVVFSETVVESSSVKCVAETPNKHNRLALVAEPLDDGLAVAMEAGKAVVPSSLPDAERKKMEKFFQSQFGWDLLATHSIWAFGPDPSLGANVLLDDSLGSKEHLRSAQRSIVQGFRWGTREGPLCDELVRNVKFKILDADISSQPLLRGGGQIIPTARRAVYSSFLAASPRLLEPVYKVVVQAPADCIQALYPVIQRRRGFVLEDIPRPGAPFYTLNAFVPVIDRYVPPPPSLSPSGLLFSYPHPLPSLPFGSFGLETDVRAYTQGQAYLQMLFDHWAVVPGDPLNADVILHPLEPSVSAALARDFMVKTRRRKGLGDEVSIDKYLDQAVGL